MTKKLDTVKPIKSTGITGFKIPDAVKNMGVTIFPPEESVQETIEIPLPIKKTAEGITPEDLAAIQKAKQKLGFTALRAQNAILESQMAELEQKNLTFSLFLKYRLTEQDQINETTGEIVRNTK